MSSSRESSPPPPYHSPENSPSPTRGTCPPPLPPRAVKNTIHLNPGIDNGPRPGPYAIPEENSQSWARRDPRSSSMQSLLPVESSASTGRRRLLIIYVHGFMGTETSFKSFPSHVHNLLTVALVETHVVHSKIYPRYKSRRPIEYAADDFSNWLCPHENENTDVILVGHSMGGILAADVALLPAYSRNSNEALRHRILGVIAFDVPFLGMHPRVISTGLASLFRSKPNKIENPQRGTESVTPSGCSSASMSSTASLDTASFFGELAFDANFNPTFVNDKRSVERQGWQKAAYFIQKHSDELSKATTQYFKSHIEFGGCLADYPGLKRRYSRIRALEDVDDLKSQRDEHGKLLRRVRFVNYYSASSGYIKPRDSIQPNSNAAEPPALEMQDMKVDDAHSQTGPSPSPTPIPTISVDDSHSQGGPSQSLPSHSMASGGDGQITEEDTASDTFEDATSEPELRSVEPAIYHSDDHRSVSGDEQEPRPTHDIEEDEASETTPSVALPPLPVAPAAFDPSLYSTSDSLKLAQKEHAKTVKDYERSLKEREKAIKEREKLVRKTEKAASKEKAKQEKAAAKALAKAEKAKRRQLDMEEKEQVKRSATINPEIYDRQLENDRSEQSEGRKKKKDRKFCALPPKDTNGERDRTWIRVYMEGVDEVEAHTTLFNVSETYEKLVGDTAARIEEWVHEDTTTKLLMQDMKLSVDGDEQS